jgi:4-carboxymuconolactone decarboxylase
MTAHGRLRWLAPDELETDARAVYDRIAGSRGPAMGDAGRLHGPFNAMLYNPPIGNALQELGAAIRYRGSLPPRAREIAILELAALRRSPFEWYAHARAGKAAGLSEDEIAAVRDGAPAATLEAGETHVRELVRTLVRERDLDDAAYAAAAGRLGAPQLIELIALVGYYDLLALSLRVFRTPLPAGVAPPFEEA